ncbi:YoaH family protein [Erwinia phyllosphaerae]|uniref:YoaH family protein n=1 Tax=Erwinia phyllosphaerae TaxID=2853256 RepID=UPI001FEE29AD|nr:YoaH family protein [Erwinia phyllosphaerae]MBV4365057.1 YoaH family protein [Erwinia phyllosphaerae]
MITGLPALTLEQQQQAVERIQELMADGMSSGQAIQLVAAEIRENHTGDMIAVRFEDEDDDGDGSEGQEQHDDAEDDDDH